LVTDTIDLHKDEFDSGEKNMITIALETVKKPHVKDKALFQKSSSSPSISSKDPIRGLD
jgi:poly(A) polymerase Pap1